MSPALIVITTIAVVLTIAFTAIIGYYMYKSYHFLGRAIDHQTYMDNQFYPKLLESFNRTIEAVENKRDKIGLNPPKKV